MSVESFKQTLATARQEHWGVGKTLVEAVKSFFKGHSVSPSASSQSRFTPPKSDEVRFEPLKSRHVSTDDSVNPTYVSGYDPSLAGLVENYFSRPGDYSGEKPVYHTSGIADDVVKMILNDDHDEGYIANEFGKVVFEKRMSWEDIETALDEIDQTDKASDSQMKMLEAAGKNALKAQVSMRLADELLGVVYANNPDDPDAFSDEVKDLLTNPRQFSKAVTEHCAGVVADTKLTLDQQTLALVQKRMSVIASGYVDVKRELFPDLAALHTQMKADRAE